MATFCNRSRIVVKVPKRPELERQFPYGARRLAERHVRELRENGLSPRLEQLEDAIQVRIRTEGYPDTQFTATSWDEALRDAQRIEDERKRSLFIDYSRSMRVTYVDLIRRYLLEECPRHRSGEMESYKLNAILVDSGEEPVSREEQSACVNSRIKTRKATGHVMRRASGKLAWLRKPFACVVPTDIEDYINERLQFVKPATVDREIDILSAVTNVAIKTWRYNVHQSPMLGVRRPRYFNERDRRLQGDEEVRLIAAALEEDRQVAINKRFDELVAETRCEAFKQWRSRTTVWSHLKAREVELRIRAEATAVFVPYYSTFVRFQLLTASRRGEAMNLTWQNVNCAERYVYFPETKNGRPRKVAMRSDLLSALNGLPQDEKQVFRFSIDELRNAWERICKRAFISDLTIHDLRHEAISRIAETGKFSLLDLQAISGHREPRMLQRYAHLCTRKLAERLDEALGTQCHSEGARSASNCIRATSTGEETAEDGAAQLRRELGDGLTEGHGERPQPTAWPANVIPLSNAARRR